MSNVIPIHQIDASATLSADEVAAIESSCKHYPQRSAAAIDALQIVQRNRRWISDEVLAAVAKQLDMSPAEVEGVATFYNHLYRHPVGDHVIHVCNSISCWLHDFQNISEHLCKRLNIEFGQTTPDGKVTLLNNVCLGCCDKAPAIMLDGQLIEQVDAQKIDDIIDGISGGGNG